jgi:hypothetical protein
MLCLGVEMNVNAIYQADQLVRYSGWLHANPSTTLLRQVYLAHGSRFSASGNASLTIIDGPSAGKTLSDLYNMLLAARRSRGMQRHQRSDPGGHGIGYDRPMAGRASPRALAFPSGDGDHRRRCGVLGTGSGDQALRRRRSRPTGRSCALATCPAPTS